MGAGNLARKQIIQGLLFLAGELAYIFYMVFYGAKALQNFVTLGTETQKKVFNEATQVYEYATGDNSQLCLLYGGELQFAPPILRRKHRKQERSRLPSARF